MTEPLYKRHDGNQNPRPDRTPNNHPARDSNHASEEAQADDWFHRTASRPAPPAVPRARPAPDREGAPGDSRPLRAVPAARPGPSRDELLARLRGEHPRSLTWKEIQYFVAHDYEGEEWDEDFHHDVVLFDRLIDADPEMEP